MTLSLKRNNVPISVGQSSSNDTDGLISECVYKCNTSVGALDIYNSRKNQEIARSIDHQTVYVHMNTLENSRQNHAKITVINKPLYHVLYLNMEPFKIFRLFYLFINFYNN